MHGHSVGEYVAACIAGVFSLEDGLKLIAARAKLMDSVPREGSMAAVFAPESQVAAALKPHAASVGIAAVNGQTGCAMPVDREVRRGPLVGNNGGAITV